jgi:hypothetical protein
MDGHKVRVGLRASRLVDVIQSLGGQLAQVTFDLSSHANRDLLILIGIWVAVDLALDVVEQTQDGQLVKVRRGGTAPGDGDAASAAAGTYVHDSSCFGRCWAPGRT